MTRFGHLCYKIKYDRLGEISILISFYIAHWVTLCFHLFFFCSSTIFCNTNLQDFWQYLDNSILNSFTYIKWQSGTSYAELLYVSACRVNDLFFISNRSYHRYTRQTSYLCSPTTSQYGYQSTQTTDTGRLFPTETRSETSSSITFFLYITWQGIKFHFFIWLFYVKSSVKAIIKVNPITNSSSYNSSEMYEMQTNCQRGLEFSFAGCR